MERNRRYSFKNIMLASFWIALGGATIFLLVAAIKTKEAHHCKNIEINIHGVSNNFFVDKKDILNAITAMEKTNPVGKAIGSFNLKKMEVELEKNVWIKSAELFFDNNETLQVTVQEREPVARVFTVTGATFYIDNDLMILPLSEKFSARLPVFTNFPSDNKVLAKSDSSLLMDVKTISLAIQKDSFSMAMIDQVDITPKRLFEMIPKIGNQLIVFGDATDVDAKLDKLKTFYKDIMVKAGWNYYSVINLQYKNQVVAKRKGAEDVTADSLRTRQMLLLIADRAQREASDSLQIMQPDNDRNTVDSNMIQQSIQRDENDEPAVVNTRPDELEAKKIQPVINTVKAATVKKETKPIVKPVQKPAPVKIDSKQPKAVMGKKNEY
ncbi:MAG: FtsQ-type POTRA domain-containing protein [Ferruginibacter sp.]